jgi:hypothetical protein
MAITSTAGRREKLLASRPEARLLIALVAIVFLTSQLTALTHEFEHVLHQHEAPCALHVAAEHLTIVAPPSLPLPAALTPLAAMPLANTDVLPSFGERSTAARAPPRSA